MAVDARQHDLVAPTRTSRILAIDPGSVKLGWAVVARHGRHLSRVASGCIRAQRDRAVPWRLGYMLTALEEMVEEHCPLDAVACEDTFIGDNPKTALVIGSVRGLVMATAGRAGMPFHLINPTTAKKSVAGHGKADKEQVKRAVKMLLRLDMGLQEDEADALALGIHAVLSEPGARPVPEKEG